MRKYSRFHFSHPHLRSSFPISTSRFFLKTFPTNRSTLIQFPISCTFLRKVAAELAHQMFFDSPQARESVLLVLVVYTLCVLCFCFPLLDTSPVYVFVHSVLHFDYWIALRTRHSTTQFFPSMAFMVSIYLMAFPRVCHPIGHLILSSWRHRRNRMG